jgi:preprotein translocase subunit YajC
MNFLISEAWADAPAAAAQQGPGLGFMVWIAVMFAFMYFLMIRPQSKRAKEHRALIAALAKGDEVVVSGGMLGRVTDLSEGYVTIEIAEGVNIKLQRHAVQAVLPKGTIKSA